MLGQQQQNTALFLPHELHQCIKEVMTQKTKRQVQKIRKFFKRSDGIYFYKKLKEFKKNCRNSVVQAYSRELNVLMVKCEL